LKFWDLTKLVLLDFFNTINTIGRKRSAATFSNPCKLRQTLLFIHSTRIAAPPAYAAGTGCGGLAQGKWKKGDGGIKKTVSRPRATVANGGRTWRAPRWRRATTFRPSY